MGSSKYKEKCLGLFDNERFVKITDDPTKRIECKIQRCVRKIRNKISKQNTYSCILLVLHPENFTKLPEFTSYPLVMVLMNFVLDQQYQKLTQHSISYQSIWLNYCHYSVNQNILLKIQKNFSRISKDCLYQRIITN